MILRETAMVSSFCLINYMLIIMRSFPLCQRERVKMAKDTKSDKKNSNIQLVFELTEDDSQNVKRLVIDDIDKYTIVDKEQAKGFIKKMMKENERIKDTRGHFIISKNDNVKSLEGSTLTTKDRSCLMQLLVYAQFDGNPLMKDGEPLNVKSIAELWGYNQESASKRIKKYIDLGILVPVKNVNDKRIRNFHLNEDYYLMGRITDGEKFVKLFKRKLAEVIDRVKVLEAKESRKKKKTEVIDILGLLNAVMPYFHYQTYYLVNNPDENILRGDETVNDALERKASPLKHLTRTQIGRILGYKRIDLRTIDKYMDYLQQSGAVMVTKNKNRRRYLIHPDLMFRADGLGQDDYTRTIRNQFGEHDK